MTEVGLRLRTGTEYILNKNDPLYEIKKAYNEGRDIEVLLDDGWHILVAGVICGDPKGYRVR